MVPPIPEESNEGPERVVEIIADGLDGPTLIFNDGTVEHIPVDPDRPPALVHDITFEERHGGVEVWFTDLIAYEHEDEVDAFVEWLEAHPGIDSVLFEDPVVVIVDGRWDQDLKTEIQHWWSSKVEGLDVEQ
jgi:hypothetical protein